MLSSLTNRLSHTQLRRAEQILLLIVLTVGTLMAGLIPPGAGYDEEDHLMRVWELAGSHFIPGQLSPREMQYPIVFRDFGYRQQGSRGVIDAEFWQTYGRADLNERGYVRNELDTKSVYSPALLLPQAIALRIGRRLGLPALPVFFLSRLASLVSYLVLTWLAIRLIPYGKWILLVLAVTPMALFQAATVSADAISNGIGFLFIAGCLRLNERAEIREREWGGLLVLIFLLFLAKLNLVPLIVLPFLLISPSRFPKRGHYVVLVIGTLLLFIVEVVGWTVIAAQNASPLVTQDADLNAQMFFVLENPFRFLWIVVRDVFSNGLNYLQGWINGYGYYYWTPPVIVSLLFLLSLIAVLLADPMPERLGRRARIVLLSVFLLCYLATVAPLYLTFTAVGADRIDGVQGRYFVPLALLLFLPLASSAWKLKLSGPLSRWTTTFLGPALVLNALGIYLSFHVECGSTFYQTGLCYRPLSKDLTDPGLSPPVTGETSLEQGVQVQCDGLAEIRLLFGPVTPGDRGMTRFRLLDSASGQTLLDTSLTNNQLSTQDWVPLRFPPDWHSAGHQYTLHITGEDSRPGQGVTLLYSSQPDFDLGDLYQNRQFVEEDVILQYGCVTGLRKLWWTGAP